MPAVEAAVEALQAGLPADVPPGRRRFEALGALTSDPLLAAWETRAPAFHRSVLDTRAELEARPVPYKMAEMTGRYGWISPVAAEVVRHTAEAGEATVSDRIDAVVTHRIVGPAHLRGRPAPHLPGRVHVGRPGDGRRSSGWSA